MARLLAHDWPGNVRELENANESAIALGSGPILSDCDLPEKIQYGPVGCFAKKSELLSWKEIEHRALFRALRETRGDRLSAARLLGIGKTTLYRKLQQYGNGHSKLRIPSA
jgi:transcriptional regulator of acetoin/glycerol metabolism